MTNIDYRTKGDASSVDRYNPSLKFADVGTMTKSHFKQRIPSEATIKQKWQTSGGWLIQQNPDPRLEGSLTMYEEKGKKVLNQV